MLKVFIQGDVKDSCFIILRLIVFFFRDLGARV